MINIKQKPVILKGEQWNGQEIDGLRIFKNEIIYSRDHKLYYITNCDARDWLSTDVQEDGKYIAYSFSTYEIKSDPKREKGDITHPLVELYLDMFNLTLHKPEARYGELNVEIGDWCVIGVDGEKQVIKPKIFELLYEIEGEIPDLVDEFNKKIIRGEIDISDASITPPLPE